MTLLGIAWRNIRQRPLTSSLTVFSLALGVGLVVATLITGGIVRQAFESGTGLGYNMIVGAKGSPLQLVLNSVYYISKPIENISWEFYSEFLPASRRSDGEDGDFAASVAVAAPICMGDYYRGYLVIGTNADLFGKLQRSRGRSFEFADGRNLETRVSLKRCSVPPSRLRRGFAWVMRSSRPTGLMTAQSMTRSSSLGWWPPPTRRSTAGCLSTWRAFISKRGMPSRSTMTTSRPRQLL